MQPTFVGGGPTWGDLVAFSIGGAGREFPLSGRYDVGQLSSLGFERVDDYLGIRNRDSTGDDVIVWLYPIVDDEEVYHHPGPFDALRLKYSVLRNPVARVNQFLAAVAKFMSVFGVPGLYRLQSATLRAPEDLGVLRQDIEAMTQHWTSEVIEPGSSEALQFDH